MIKLNAIDHLNMNVTDLKRAVEFYTKYFNFSVYGEGESDYGPYALLSVPGKLALCLYEKGEQEIDRSHVNHLGFHVENFDETFELVKQYNIPFEYGGPIEYPQSRSLYILDPDGNEWEISEKMCGGH